MTTMVMKQQTETSFWNNNIKTSCTQELLLFFFFWVRRNFNCSYYLFFYWIFLRVSFLLYSFLLWQLSTAYLIFVGRVYSRWQILIKVFFCN